MWIALSVLAFALWSVAMFLPKILLRHFSPLIGIIYEVAGNIPLAAGLGVWLAVQGGMAFDPVGASLSALAGVCGVGGMLAYFAAMRRGPVAVIVTVTALYPVISVLLSLLLLGEAVSGVQAGGIALALVGSGLMTFFSEKDDEAAMVRAGWIIPTAISLLCFGVMVVLPKLAMGHDLDPGSAMLYEIGGSLVATLVPLGMVRFRPVCPPRIAFVAIVVGFVNILAMWFYILAIQDGPVSIASTISGMYPLGATLLAVVFLRERLTLPQWAGVALGLVGIGLLSQQAG